VLLQLCGAIGRLVEETESAERRLAPSGRSDQAAVVSAVFDNTDRCDHMTGGGLEARTLAARISGAWVQFARTGNPNHGGLPPWPAFGTEKRPAMVFDDTCAVKDDPDGDELKALAGSMRWT
jgi:carboxylesterase type B